MGDDDKGRRLPAVVPSQPRRRRGHGALPRTVGIVLIAVLAGGCGVVAAGRAGADGPAGGAGQPRSSPAPAMVASPVPTAPAAAGTPGPLTPDSQLSPIGIGPVETGMTVEEAERAGGVALLPWADEYYPDCWYVVPEGWEGDDDPAVSFLVRGDATTGERLGLITLVQVGSGSTSTREGIRIGSTEQDVHEAYPGQVVATVDRLGQRLLVYVPPQIGGPDLDFRYGAMAFESDGRQVTGIRAGAIAEVITLDEGCA